jgi:PEP-utilising enzyme, mobile domain
VLSHLAILAREAGVPTVVGYTGAISDLLEGAVVEVDGDTGRVTLQGEDAEPTDGLADLPDVPDPADLPDLPDDHQEERLP